MPKAKYKPMIPSSRIKQIMRTDEEVGRVAAGALVCVSKAVQLFLEKVVKAILGSLGEEKKINLTHLYNNIIMII